MPLNDLGPEPTPGAWATLHPDAHRYVYAGGGSSVDAGGGDPGAASGRPVSKGCLGFGVVLPAGFGALAVGAVFLVEIPVRLVVGWWLHLARTLPEVTVAPATIAWGVGAALLLAGGPHLLASRVREGRWEARWTALGVGLLVFLFATSIAGLGAIHQVAWIVGSDRPIVQSSWDSTPSHLRRACGDLPETEDVAELARAAADRQGPYGRGTTVDRVVVPHTGFEYVVLARPHERPELEEHGFVLCVDGRPSEYEADMLDEILALAAKERVSEEGAE